MLDIKSMRLEALQFIDCKNLNYPYHQTLISMKSQDADVLLELNRGSELCFIKCKNVEPQLDINWNLSEWEAYYDGGSVRLQLRQVEDNRLNLIIEDAFNTLELPVPKNTVIEKLGNFDEESKHYYALSCEKLECCEIDLLEYRLMTKGIRWQYFNEMQGLECLKTTNYRTKWYRHFVEWDRIKNMPNDMFIWCVIDRDIEVFLKNQEAIEAFEQTPKDTLILCFEEVRGEKKFMILENASELKEEDLPTGIEIVLTDLEFTWSYIVTHETHCCGPYFVNGVIVND